MVTTKFILTQFNFWNLVQYFKSVSHEIVYKKAPDYIVDFFKKYNVHAKQYDEKPADAEVYMGSYLEWPQPEELTEEILQKKYYIDDDNFFSVMSAYNSGDMLLYSESLTKEIPDGIEKRFISKSTPELMPKERIMLTRPRASTSGNVLNDVPKEYDIVHYIGNVVGAVKYRRHLLNDWLHEKGYKVATIYSGYVDLSKAKLLIISDPRDSLSLVWEAKERGLKIVYDRTDNWEALYEHVEDYLFANADLVFCSSQYLYDTCRNENKHLIINAARRYFRRSFEKEKMVVYVGKSTNKTDEAYTEYIKGMYPDYEFVSIGAKINGWKNMALMDWKTMMRYLEKAEIGIIPIKGDEYYKGQFNLKLWDYLLAGCKVVTRNKYNYEGIKNVYTSMDEAISSEWEHVDFVYWDEQFEKMRKIYNDGIGKNNL